MSEIYFNLLHELAIFLGLSPEELRGTEELVIDDLPVGLTFSGDDEIADLVFFADLGKPAPDRDASVHRVLLEANGLWAGTGGATLGLHSGSGNLLICARVPLEGTTAPGLAEVLDVFVDTAHFWQLYISGASLTESSPVSHVSDGLFAAAA